MTAPWILRTTVYKAPTVSPYYKSPSRFDEPASFVRHRSRCRRGLGFLWDVLRGNKATFSPVGIRGSVTGWEGNEGECEGAFGDVAVRIQVGQFSERRTSTCRQLTMISVATLINRVRQVQGLLRPADRTGNAVLTLFAVVYGQHVDQ